MEIEAQGKGTSWRLKEKELNCVAKLEDDIKVYGVSRCGRILLGQPLGAGLVN
jgi:hypothetical protein